MDEVGDSGVHSSSLRSTLRGGFRTRRARPSLELASSPSSRRRESLAVTVDLTAGQALTSRDLEPVDPSASGVADPLIGVVVADRYRILEPIGRGGMGVVYKVNHLRIGKLCALKLLAGDLAREHDVARRFKREAFTASRLESPNTVSVFDYGVSGDFTYLVMELVRGENLGRVLRAAGPLPLPRLTKIMVQICNALAEAHEKGIIHRDIKPDNVMILTAPDGAEVVKVLDFGLAKLKGCGEFPEITSRGTIVGTPYYMAPEQIRGDEVDARTDIYAAGALMYRLLTGHHPFSGSPVTVMAKQVSEEPIPPAERAPELGIPVSMSRLVLRALRKDPAERFQSVEELRAALVEEMRASGASSVERLLDPSRVMRLARRAASAATPPMAAATRDEVDAYERRLRRRRYGALGTAALLFALGAGGAVAAVAQARAFDGAEVEPNDAPESATVVPLGRAVRGQIGRRIDTSHGDRDFYAFDVPGPRGATALVTLRLSGLPNMATCALLYRPGLSSPIGTFCAGEPGRDVEVTNFAVSPGRHFVAVVQDMSARGGASAPVQENVSDWYTLSVTVEATAP